MIGSMAEEVLHTTPAAIAHQRPRRVSSRDTAGLSTTRVGDKAVSYSRVLNEADRDVGRDQPVLPAPRIPDQRPAAFGQSVLAVQPAEHRRTVSRGPSRRFTLSAA